MWICKLSFFIKQIINIIIMSNEKLIQNLIDINKKLSDVLIKKELISIQDSGTETGLNNPIISAIFMIFGGSAVVFLFLVLLIHMKYSKLRHNLYGIIFSCIICEYFFCVIYFIHGIDYLTFKFLESSNGTCNAFSFIGNFFIGSLISYNIFLTINILTKRIPPLRETGSKATHYNDNKESYFNLKKFSYTRVHFVSFLIGFFNALYIYFTDNLGRMQTGTCFIKDNPNNFIFISVAGFVIYFILAVVFIFCDKLLKNNYYKDFPILKKYFVYLFLTSIGWALWLFCLLEQVNDDVVNCISISGGLIVFFGISYYRFSSGYVKSILHQESSNRLIAGIMIMLCLDNRADPDLYDFKSSFNFKIEDRNMIN